MRSPVITMISGLLSDSSFNNSALFFPNSALCRSYTCAIWKPENAAGIRLLEIATVFVINALLPHTVQINKVKNIVPMTHNIIRAFLINHFLIFPHHLSEDRPLNQNAKSLTILMTMIPMPNNIIRMPGIRRYHL